MKLSLFGYMGSGKSTIGKILAQKLNLNFLDLDELIAENQGISLSEIFTNYGEIHFRKIEQQVLKDIVENQENFVLSTGGGTPCYYENAKFLIENTYSIYLRLNPHQLMLRLSNEKQQRPLIAHIEENDLTEFIAKHLFERKKFYEKAELILEAGNKPPEEISIEIIPQLPHQ